MKSPRRLVDGDATDFERDLLRAARGGRPSAQARRRTLKAVAVGAGALGAAAGGSSSVMASVGVSALVKWGVVGVAATALAVGGAQTLRSPVAPAKTNDGISRVVVARAASFAEAPPSPAEGVESTGREADSSPGAPPVVTQPAAPPSAFQAPQPPAPAPTPRAVVGIAAGASESSAPSGANAVPPPSGGSHGPSGDVFAAPAGSSGPPPVVDAKTLADEVAALDRARAALDAKDPDAALRALESRERRHGAGRMGPEATLLRVRALVRKGDHASASALANAYLASDPHSPYAARIRAALAPEKKSSPSE